MASSNGWSLAGVIKRVFGPSAAQTRHARRSPSRKPLFEAMEPRFLLSADPMGLAAPTDPVDTTQPAVTGSLTDAEGSEAAAPAVSGAPPVTVPDMYVVTEDVVFVLDDPTQGVLANDGDATGLKAILHTGPAHGDLELHEDGTFIYRPDPDYSRPDEFTYVAQDETGATSAVTTVAISVEGVADTPVAVGDTYEMRPDTTLEISYDAMLSNDYDVDEDTLTWNRVVVNPVHGTLEQTPTGLVYRPADGFVGRDSFTYTVIDFPELPESLPAEVVILVGLSNAAPVANADGFSANANTPLTVSAEQGLLANDSDADGDSLVATLLEGPANGRVTVRPDGGFTYTPDLDFQGTDEFTYKASDGALESEAVVVITVTASNAAPTAQADEFSTNEDTALVVGADNGLLANDADADGDTLEAVLVEEPDHGLVTLNADGSFSYTPEADFSGEDSFTYRASDGALQSEPVTVTIEVLALANHQPVFSSTPVTTFTIDADATGFDGDGVFRVAGAAGEPVRVELNWTFREALYNNEVGIYRVAAQDGRVGDLLPGAAGYAKAALAAGNAQVVFASGASAGAHFELQLEGGALYAFYVIQNGKTSTFLASNPDNRLDGGTLAFFSIAGANPDGFDHLHAEIQPQTGLLALRWEDLTRGGDADYNDVVMTGIGLAASSNDVMYVYGAQAQDVDGNELTYRLAQGPRGAFIDPHTGVLSWAATAGVFHFVVQADDGKGGVAEQTFDLTVDTRSTDLVIKGTGGKDRIEVSERDGLVTVRVNDVARTYSHVSSLRVDALGGDDEVWLRGLTMNATVDGGDGNDCIDASAVAQLGVVLYGGAGNDRLTGGAGNDRMDGGTGDDELNGGCGNDLLVGGLGKDCLNGGDGNDLLDGGGDNDQLRGGKGNDLLVADSGDDYLKGEDGNDILVGGTGNDSSQGNYGADLTINGPGCDSTGSLYSQDRLVDGAAYGIPATLPAQPPGPVIDWSSRYVALVGALQQFRDHPSNPQWWQDFVNNLGKTEGDANPNSRIRVVGPGTEA